MRTSIKRREVKKKDLNKNAEREEKVFSKKIKKKES